MTNSLSAMTTAWPQAGGDRARGVFGVLGMACIAGFATQLLALALPPDPMALEWRLAVMQQVSGSSVLLFLGLAMVIYSSLGQRSRSRLVALGCLGIGLLFLLSGVLVIRDGLVLQTQTLEGIASEATELRSQLQAAQTNPSLAPQIAPDRIQTALIELDIQTELITESARQATTQSMVTVLGAQVVFGLGLLGLGRFGIKHAPKELT